MFTICARILRRMWAIVFCHYLCGNLVAGPRHAQLYIFTSGHLLLCNRGLFTLLGILLTVTGSVISVVRSRLLQGIKMFFLAHESLLCFLGRRFAGSDTCKQGSFSGFCPCHQVLGCLFRALCMPTAIHYVFRFPDATESREFSCNLSLIF